MAIRKKRQDSYCPRCHAPDEHLLHIMTCPSPSTKELQVTLIDKLKIWLINGKTHPDITSFFILGLTKWFRNHSFSWPRFSDIFTNDNLVNKAFNTQLSIGWFPTLCGFLSSPLIDIQQQYFLDCGSRKSSCRWATNLTKQLWNITHQL